MRLMLRFYDVHSGSVTIDGQDVRNLTQHTLRKEIGVVAQDTVREFLLWFHDNTCANPFEDV